MANNRKRRRSDINEKDCVRRKRHCGIMTKNKSNDGVTMDSIENNFNDAYDGNEFKRRSVESPPYVCPADAQKKCIIRRNGKRIKYTNEQNTYEANWSRVNAGTVFIF